MTGWKVRLPAPVCLEALHGAYKSDAPVQFVSICISTPYTDEWGSKLPHDPFACTFQIITGVFVIVVYSGG
jgi:hypothetical protein